MSTAGTLHPTYALHTSGNLHLPPPTRIVDEAIAADSERDRSTPTPNLSGPTTPVQAETPHTVQLQTPSTTIGMDDQRAESSASSSRAVSPTTEAIEGVSYSAKGKGKGRAYERASEGAVQKNHSGVENGDEDMADWSDERQWGNIKARIAQIETGGRSGDAWSQRDELLGMAKTLLRPVTEDIPFLQERLAAQQDTIRTMQQQSKLSEQLTAIERQRHLAERESWHAETRALMNAREAEIAAGTRQRRVLDLDVGYHQELEAANKRLEMDNRLMAPRLVDTQRQIDKLVNELRLLRSNVILSSQPITRPGDAPLRPSHQLPPTPAVTSYLPGMSRRKSRSPTKGTGRTTMGDARTEHLLLAARRVRTMRQVDERVGKMTFEELKKQGVVGPEGGVGYSEGYGGPESDAEDEDSEIEEKPTLGHARRPSTSVKAKSKSNPHSQSQSQSQPQGTPLLPRAKKSGKRPINPPPIPQTPSKASRKKQPQTTPGGSNFNDLLRAAEMATRPGTPTPEERSQIAPLSAMSATRSTTRVRDESHSDRSSPVKRARKDEWSSGREEEGIPLSLLPATQQTQVSSESQQSASALDLLAQASQLEVAQSGDMSSGSSSAGPTLSSATRLGGMLEDLPNPGSSPRSIQEPILGPAIDLTPTNYIRPPPIPRPVEDYQVDPSLTTPKGRSRAYSNASELATPTTGRAYASSQVYPTPGGESIYGEEGTPKTDPLMSYASPTGATVPGLGKYVHLTSSMPARRVRSPYLKWTVEEDELLARAVAIHGEKWDLVSKGVPTRSYHQVRQRWLRKTGAFDKKPSTEDDRADGALPPVVDVDVGPDEALDIGMEIAHGRIPGPPSGGLADDDGSPTPEGGRKRRQSQLM